MNPTASKRIACCALLLGILSLATSCTHTPKDKDGTWVASWYGKPFHGRKTASGETYNMYGLSAAHKHLPFGTRLNITNPENGRRTVVVINDRGPFVRGRDLDLSLGAARKLDMVEDGVILVDVRVLPSDTSYTREISNESRGYALQLGSFSDRASAETVRQQIINDYPHARITTVKSGGKTFYRVLAGSFPTRSAASSAIPSLQAKGYKPLIREFF